MSGLSWIGTPGIGLEIAALAGDSTAKKLLETLYNGAFQVDIGDSVNAYYGECNTHVFGHQTELVMSTNVTKLAGLFAGYASGGGGFWQGVRGKAEFVYGACTHVTYGGPESTIRRGATMTRVSDTPLPGLISAAYSYRTAPGGQPANAAAAGTVADDEATVLAVSSLSTLLFLVVAGTELGVRFGYPNYPKTDRTVPHILAKINNDLVPRIMGLIYGIEEIGGWSTWVETYWSWLTWLLTTMEGKTTLFAVGAMAVFFLAAVIVAVVSIIA